MPTRDVSRGELVSDKHRTHRTEAIRDIRSPSSEGLHVPLPAVASGVGRQRPTLTLGRGADVAQDTNGSVLIEILAREDCPNRGMALVVVERVVDETGIPAEIEVVDVESDSDAEEYRVLGSPTVLVDGRDVDPEPIPCELQRRRPHLQDRSRPVRLARAGVDPRRASSRGRADALRTARTSRRTLAIRARGCQRAKISEGVRFAAARPFYSPLESSTTSP